MLELCTRKDKNGIPIASAEMLDRYASGILVEFQSNILKQQKAVDIFRLATVYFGVQIRKKTLTPDYSVLAMTTLEPVRVKIFDSTQGWVDIDLPEKTILVDESLYEAGQKARLHFVIAHELGHIACHKNVQFSVMKAKGVPEDTDKLDVQDTEDKAVPWAEWQADYMASALLMPKTPFCNAFQSYAGYGGGMEPMSEQRIAELAANLARDFQVSKQAAYIRMYKLDLVSLAA